MQQQPHGHGLVVRRRLAILADEIGQEVAASEADFQSAVSHAIRAGEKLIEAKGLVAHGEWSQWLAKHFPGSQRTARNYMRLAANRQRVADLPSVREAVALLAAPKQEPKPALPPAEPRREDYRTTTWAPPASASRRSTG